MPVSNLSAAAALAIGQTAWWSVELIDSPKLGLVALMMPTADADAVELAQHLKHLIWASTSPAAMG